MPIKQAIDAIEKELRDAEKRWLEADGENPYLEGVFVGFCVALDKLKGFDNDSTH